MATRVFNLMNGGIRYGNTFKTPSSGTYYPGLLVKLDTSGSTVSTSGSTAALKPFGFLFGDRTTIYRPTTRNYGNSEIVTVVNGTGYAQMSSDLFDEAALPATIGATIYAAASGLWTVNVTSNKVGTYVQTVKRDEPVGGVGVSQNLAVVQFNLVP
jgi:hypothetical protein